MPRNLANPLTTAAPTADPANILSQLQGNPDIASLLGGMGLSLPDHIKQNMILPEAGTDNFFGQHPRVTRGLENAFLAMANMGPTSMSAGDNISNVARSVLNIPHQREAYEMNQIMAPFQVGGMVNQLREGSANAELASARAQYFKQRGDYYANGGKAPKVQFLNTDNGIYSVDEQGNLAQEHDAAGNPLMPWHAQGNGGTEMERFMNGSMFQSVNEGRMKAGLPPLKQDEFTQQVMGFIGAKAAAAGAGSTAGRYGVPGTVTPASEQQYQKDKEVYNQQRGDLEKKRSLSDISNLLEADSMFPNDPKATDKYLAKIQSQIDDLDRSFNTKYPKVGTPAPTAPKKKTSSAVSSFIQKHSQ